MRTKSRANLIRKRFLVTLGVTLIIVKCIIPFLSDYTKDFGSSWLPSWEYVISLF